MSFCAVLCSATHPDHPIFQRLYVFRSENPVSQHRKATEDIDCDLRALAMHFFILRKVMQHVQQATAKLEKKRSQTLQSVNALIASPHRNCPARNVPRIPTEVVARIWQIYSRFPMHADDRVGVAPQRLLDDSLVEEARVLGVEAHFERPVALELPYASTELLQQRLLHLPQSVRTKLSISVDFNKFFDTAGPQDSQLDQCLFFAPQWDELFIFGVGSTDSIGQVLMRCAAAIPNLRYLLIQVSGHLTVLEPFDQGVLRMTKLQYANISHDFLPALKSLFLNVVELHLDIPTLSDVTEFFRNVLPSLPKSLEKLFLCDPQLLIDNDDLQHVSEDALAATGLPPLKVLAIQGIDNFPCFINILSLFKGFNIQTLVISFWDNVTYEDGLISEARLLIQAIHAVLPSLSTLAFTATSVWACEPVDLWKVHQLVSLSVLVSVFCCTQCAHCLFRTSRNH